LGIGAVFELPVLIFMLIMLRVASPRWLLAHSRYAILIITILAAIITPTPDVVNLTIFAAPMILLYFMGVFAGYIMVLRREGEKFPWKIVLYWLAGLLGLAALVVYVMVARYGFQFAPHWPFLVR
jgi:sec-independent protein translocase protein TatC